MTISDVKLHLTQLQFRRLIALSQSIPRVLTGPKDTSSAQNIPSSNEQLIEPASSETTIDLQPELREMSGSDHPKTWTSVDLFVTLDVVKLHLYDSLASTEQNLRDHGIARFALNSSTLRAKMLQDGALEAEVVLKSFTMSNTRPGNSKFREIIPAAHHTRNQVMVLYTMSSGADKSAMAVVTVDSPQIIFAIEPIMALLEFFTSSTNEDRQIEDAVPNVQSDETASSPQSSTLNVRFDLHDVSVSVLENDSDVESRAIRLSIKQIFLSQQVRYLPLNFLSSLILVFRESLL